MPRLLPSVLAAAALAAAALAPAPLAQTTVSAVGGRTYYTSHGGPAAGGGLAVTRALTPAVDLDLAVAYARSANDSPDALLGRGPDRWNARRHAVAAAGATVYPARFRALGARHRAGLSAAAVGRRHDDRIWQGVFYPQYFVDRPDLPIGELAAEWRALGPGYEATIVAADEAGPFTQAGDHLALTYPHAGFDVGGSLGLAYEVQAGRAAVGVRAEYRRYLDQRVGTGTHALDASVRVGVRL